MRFGVGGPARRLLGVLVDPRGAMDRVIADPHPVATGLLLLVLIALLGLGTLPRQLTLLHAAFPEGGGVMADQAARFMRAGLTRLMTADRLVASPTLMLGGLLTAIAAEPVLMLARERRAALWGVMILGLAPLLVVRVGELATVWLSAAHPGMPAGEVVLLPSRFRTGPTLLWLGGEAPPPWITRVDPVVNAISLWTVALWSVGLGRLDGQARLSTWHVALPVACVAAAAAVRWALGPLVLAALLGGP